MQIKDLFIKNKSNFKTDDKISEETLRPEIDDKIWAKCNGCNKALYEKMLINNLKVCPLCSYHFRLTPQERADITFDEGTFSEFDYTDI